MGGARCFDTKCSVSDRYQYPVRSVGLNVFILNVLGLNGSSQLLNRSEGIPVDELRDAWQLPFKNVKDGGCPGV